MAGRQPGYRLAPIMWQYWPGLPMEPSWRQGTLTGVSVSWNLRQEPVYGSVKLICRGLRHWHGRQMANFF